jgi:hypothetical protein
VDQAIDPRLFHLWINSILFRFIFNRLAKPGALYFQIEILSSGSIYLAINLAVE